MSIPQRVQWATEHSIRFARAEKPTTDEDRDKKFRNWCGAKNKFKVMARLRVEQRMKQENPGGKGEKVRPQCCTQLQNKNADLK